MRHLLFLTGVNGSGKSTLAKAIVGFGDIFVLRTTTNRPQRDINDVEYDFVQHWPPDGPLAWQTKADKCYYGVRESEFRRAPWNSIGLSLFYPGSLGELDKYRDTCPFHTSLIGLDTIQTIEEQWNRVHHNPLRSMSLRRFELQRRQVLRRADHTLRGSEDELLLALKAIIRAL